MKIFLLALPVTACSVDLIRCINLSFMLRTLQAAKTRLAQSLVVIFLVTHLWMVAPMPAASAAVSWRSVLPSDIEIPDSLQILKNKHLVSDAKRMMDATPETFCTAYSDMLSGANSSTWEAIEASANIISNLANDIVSAYLAGAGSLSGYAGVASLVSKLGLGSVTTTIAKTMGFKVAGAAATSVVTSAVGGPVVMGAIVAGGVGLTAYGIYKVGQFSAENFQEWAGEYCSAQQANQLN